MSNTNTKPNEETFRDSLATVDQEGKRKWIYPKKPSGKYTNARNIVSFLLLAIFFAGPFIKIGDNPIMLFNILERKFIIFGSIFYPQDFYIFMFAMIVGVIAIGLFTLVFGRLFCGWVCPQTIFMEMVFRKIEYWIEGDWNKQKALDKAPGSPKKTFKKVLKHSIFFLISFLISNLFLAYIIGIDELWKIVTEPPTQHLAGLISMLIFSFVFYLVFSRLREQVCTTVCPYGRLQGVLLDKHSVVVGYDYVRGESRGRFKKKEDRKALGKGDCVDCKQCVHVCPTGIDIRNGTQLECVNCTACIDACDGIMLKLGMEPGLIRYSSEHNIATGSKFKFTKRMFGFSVLLAIVSVVFVGLLFMRSSVEATVLRAKNLGFQEQDGNKISNLYNYNLVNKTNQEVPITFRLESTDGEIQLIGGDDLKLPAQGRLDGSFFVLIPKEELNYEKNRIRIGIYSGEDQIDEAMTNFLGPKKE